MALPPSVLEERVANQVWTAHNVALGGGRTTIPGRPDFLATDQRLLALRRSLSVLVGSLHGRRVADLGSLEGGFAVAMAQAGAEVVAVEARAANVEKISLLQEHLGLANLRIVHGDVKDLGAWADGPFDVVLALGILYHLDDPVGWLRDIAAVTSGVLAVDTHVAPADDLAMARLRPDLRHLGRLESVFHDGHPFTGRWFNEFPPTIPDDGREDQLWASWSNDRSFWLTEESLVWAFTAAGFDLVYEQHDLTASNHRTFTEEYPRAMYLCLRGTTP